MQNYGLLVDGKLLLSSKQLDGYKPVVYAATPQFDQITQAVVEDQITDNGDTINVSLKVIDVPQDEESDMDDPMPADGTN